MQASLPSAWAGLPAWAVLDTDFGSGQTFHKLWHTWRSLAPALRPRVLHYVGVLAQPPEGVIDPLADVCRGLRPGFQRFLLSDGHVSLTLCVGPLTQALAEMTSQFDTVVADECQAPAWDKWTVQLLARRCKRGTRLQTPGMTALPALGSWWESAGFADSQFNPRWNLQHTRHAHRGAPPPVARCAVIGAGLAGASVAQALACRGWQVTVLDAAPQPAAGASGLPAGLVVPQVSADDSPRSRLSCAGVDLMLHHARTLLHEGQDWAPSGVLEHRSPDVPLWHPKAAWIRPAQLVRAWLAQSGIHFVGNSKVASLQRSHGVWTLYGDKDSTGSLPPLAQAELVVIANAIDCTALLRTLPADGALDANVLDKVQRLTAVHGTMSFGACTTPEPLSPYPVNGQGSFIPWIPTADGAQWHAGASFETDATVAKDVAHQHAANLARLRLLLPDVGAALEKSFACGEVQHWAQTRCVTHDRLPLVGPVDPAGAQGLWLCAGMGSRGLSFAALSAELLVARLGCEPLPVASSLARSLDLHRPRRKKGKKVP